MIRQTYTFEIITPCFCGGAEPGQRAEIRTASIRGHLRWWFRVLGGFKSLATMPLRKQEELIFGSAAGDEGAAGKLIVRIEPTQLTSVMRDGQQLGHRNLSDPAYLTFPIQTREDRMGHKMGYSGKGTIESGSFTMQLIWAGNRAHSDDLSALITVFGHLGSLGFRSRRAMGALALQSPPLSLNQATDFFSAHRPIDVRQFPATSQSDAISVLGKWLRQWRAHGRSVDHRHGTAANRTPPHNQGFEWALADHDEGYQVRDGTWPPTAAHGKIPKGANHETFRAALGLPIVQNTQSGQVLWYPKWSAAKAQNNPNYKGEGRFASPIILRPYRDANGWKALVIFVDARAWQQGDPVYLNGYTKAASTELYDQMKSDAAATMASFP